jgi:hypothetical protein
MCKLLPLGRNFLPSRAALFFNSLPSDGEIARTNMGKEEAKHWMAAV